MRIAWRDGVYHLHHFPGGLVLLDHRTLIELSVLPIKTALARGRSQKRHVRATWRRSRGRCAQRGLLRDGAVAIDAIHFHCVARLAVKIAVAMIVLREVAVLAVHTFLEMDVAEVDGLLEFVLVAGRYGVALGIQQVAFAVALVDGSEDPAVSVKVGELR